MAKNNIISFNLLEFALGTNTVESIIIILYICVLKHSVLIGLVERKFTRKLGKIWSYIYLVQVLTENLL